MLFDRRTDPGQTTDRWDDPAAADQRARMLTRVVELLQEAAAPPEQYERLGLQASKDGPRRIDTGGQ